jgi:hypothetical protein
MNGAQIENLDVTGQDRLSGNHIIAHNISAKAPLKGHNNDRPVIYRRVGELSINNGSCRASRLSN